MSEIGHNNPPLDPKETIQKILKEKNLYLIEIHNILKKCPCLVGLN